jgi:hypothetical protein
VLNGDREKVAVGGTRNGHEAAHAANGNGHAGGDQTRRE